MFSIGGGSCLRKNISNHCFEIIFFCLYAVSAVALVFIHEPFSDELQAWLIARELSVVEIIHLMRYEGHFALWSLLLHPFAVAGFPVITLNLISTLLMLVSGWLLLFYSPFNRVLKILFLFSFPSVYYFPIVSRCYALIPMLLWLLAIYYPRRREQGYWYGALIVLLANTHAYMAGMAVILSLIFFYDVIICDQRGRCLKAKLSASGPFILIAGGGILTLLQVVPALFCSAAGHVVAPDWNVCSNAIQDWMKGYCPAGILPFPWILRMRIGYAAAFLAAVPILLLRLPRMAGIYAVSVGWMIFFAMCIYGFAGNGIFFPFMC